MAVYGMDRNSVPSYTIDLYICFDGIKLNCKSTDSYKYLIFVKKLVIILLHIKYY